MIFRDEHRRFSVIIPTLWKSSYLKPLLRKLVASRYVSEVIVIDNSRRFHEHCRGGHRKIRLLEPDRNLYVNPAWNLGVQEAKEDLICLCNDDILFNTRIFARMSKKTNWDRIGLVGVHRWCYRRRSHLLPLFLWPISDRDFGFGCLMFMGKSNYVQIPDDLRVFCGDDYLFRAQRHPNYAITGLRIETSMSTTSSLPEFEEVKQRDMETFNEKYQGRALR